MRKYIITAICILIAAHTYSQNTIKDFIGLNVDSLANNTGLVLDSTKVIINKPVCLSNPIKFLPD
jgi:hypothetical protein